MEKTKLGVSVGLLGAAVFFAALFGGYTTVVLVAGYILLCEENEWLKKTAVKAVVLLATFSVLSYAIGLIPDLFYWLSDFLSLIKLNISFSVIYSIVGLFTGAISIVKIVAFLMLGLKALKGEDFAIAAVDEMVNKNV
uniref:hypothetical protein n=1 Tax=Acetatifactor sp. TaxID=1872090 RepID=UPI0040573EAC